MRLGLERGAHDAVADHGDDQRQVAKLQQRREQHVRAFLVAQPARPTDDEAVGRELQDPAGGRPIAGRRQWLPRVGDLVDPRRRNAAPPQEPDERPAHGDHRVEAPERAALQPLVHAVLPPAAGEAVHRRDDRNPLTPGDARVQHVRPVTVRMHDVGAELAQQLRDRGALA